eukprot:tig00000215_g18574.t1
MSSAAAVSSVDTAEAASGGERSELEEVNCNHFERLPDELVQRIFSELDAAEAYETCQLWSLDRRFSRLMRGIRWQQLHLRAEPSVKGEHNMLERLQGYGKKLNRFTKRVKSKALAGCRQLVVGPACSRVQSLDREYARKASEAGIDATYAIAELLAALAVAPVPLEAATFSKSCGPENFNWDAFGAGDSPSLEEVVRTFQTALHPAPLRSLRLDDPDLASTFIDSTIPECLPHLRELQTATQGFDIHLDDERTAKLAENWPRLIKLTCWVYDGAALQSLARLPLEELRVSIVSIYDLGSLREALDALNAKSLRSLRISSSEEFDESDLIGHDVLTSILRFQNLEDLKIMVDDASVDVLAGIGALQKLQSLDLQLVIFRASEAEARARALKAALEGLGAAAQLKALNLDLTVGSRFLEVMDANSSAVVPLIRASRPVLRTLSLSTAALGRTVTAEILREIAQAGPKLSSVHLCYDAEHYTHVSELRVFNELLSLSSDRRPDFQLRLELLLPEALRRQASVVLRGWFANGPLPISVLIDGQII